MTKLSNTEALRKFFGITTIRPEGDSSVISALAGLLDVEITSIGTSMTTSYIESLTDPVEDSNGYRSESVVTKTLFGRYLHSNNEETLNTENIQCCVRNALIAAVDYASLHNTPFINENQIKKITDTPHLYMAYWCILHSDDILNTLTLGDDRDK